MVSDKAALFTDLEKNDTLSVSDLSRLRNLSQDDYARIQDFYNFKFSGSGPADPQYAEDREFILLSLFHMLFPLKGGMSDNGEPSPLSAADRDLFDYYVGTGDINNLHRMITEKAPFTNFSELAARCKWVDDLGHYRPKSMPEMYLGQAKHLKPMTQCVKENDPKLPDNSRVFAYLTQTRGLSPELVGFLIDKGYIYQGIEDDRWDNTQQLWIPNEPYLIKTYLVTNGVDKDGNIKSQIKRELWDTWDSLHADPEKIAKADADFARYNGKYRHKIYQSRKDENGRFVIVTENGKPKLIAPYKGDRSETSKQFAWKHVNPQSDKLFVFEGAIDAFSAMDMAIASARKKGINVGKLSDYSFDNYVAADGLDLNSIDNFLMNYPYIKTIYLCTDNDVSSKLLTPMIHEHLVEQYNFPPENVIDSSCPVGFQKVDINGMGMCDPITNKPIMCKDYNDLLRTRKAAEATNASIEVFMHSLSEFAKSSSTREVPKSAEVTEKVAKEYWKNKDQNKHKSPRFFKDNVSTNVSLADSKDYIPPMPSRSMKGGRGEITYNAYKGKSIKDQLIDSAR